ncbi:hypothetical protein [Shewanella baltica]|nr:hypothetical protein [Shewanella baltica]
MGIAFLIWDLSKCKDGIVFNEQSHASRGFVVSVFMFLVFMP